jgi:CO dehydrogenase/acetyl-CoA synthase alpha subunit
MIVKGKKIETFINNLNKRDFLMILLGGCIAMLINCFFRIFLILMDIIIQFL